MVQGMVGSQDIEVNSGPSDDEDKYDEVSAPSDDEDKDDEVSRPSDDEDEDDKVSVPSDDADKDDKESEPIKSNTPLPPVMAPCHPNPSASQLKIRHGFTSSVFYNPQPCLDEDCLDPACPLGQTCKCSPSHS